MPDIDGPGADPEGLGQASEVAGGQVHSQLVEALVLLLIEKGVLTKNDALSIIRTVAQVQQGAAVGDREHGAQRQAAVHMLQRMYVSFEALADGSGGLLDGGENIHQLRPPIYDVRPEFPHDD